jgi:hypothetical protein
MYGEFGKLLIAAPLITSGAFVPELEAVELAHRA